MMRYEGRFDVDAARPQVGYGIWDDLTGQWIAENLPGEVASMQAALLSLRYDGDAERSDDCARYVDPSIPVELHVTVSRTEAAVLHCWVREAGARLGYVTYLKRAPRDGGRWAPATALRPLTKDELKALTERQTNRRSFGLPA